MEKFIKFILLTFLFVSIISPATIYAKSGCCSWHGGVSYCDTNTGRQVCNDGTYSPSCTCAYAPPTATYVPSTPTQTDLIIAGVNNAKADYYKNPDWFRENLISRLTSQLNSDISSVAYYVYTMLPDVNKTTTNNASCCKICSTGKACGNSCISRSYTCHQPPGCACDAN